MAVQNYPYGMQNGFATQGVQQQAPAPQQSSPSTTSFGNGFTQAKGPSAVFSGMMPAVNYSPNKYLENQINQFANTQQVPMSFYERMAKMGGTPTTTGFNMGLLQGQLNNIQNQGASNIGGLLGQYQQMFQNYQNQIPAPNGGAVQTPIDGTGGNLGNDVRLGTELPGYTPDGKVGYTDSTGGVDTKVGADPLAGGDYKDTKDASGNVPKTNPYTYLNATGQSVINMSHLMDANNKAVTNSMGYTMWNGDDGKAYAGVGNIPIAVNPKTGALNFKGKENLQLDTPLGLLNVDVTGINKKTGILTMTDPKLGKVFYDPATNTYSQPPKKKGKK